MCDQLNKKVIVITGASGGIGSAIAHEMAKWGAKLALTGRRKEKVEETAATCRQMGLPAANVFTVLGDLTVKEDVDHIVENVIKHYGRIDVLVNNAGATRAKTVENCEVEDLDWCFNAIVRSVFIMTKACLPHLEKTKGAIINISSLAGLRPYVFALPYSMSKCAVDRFTQICASSPSVAGKGIRVVAVNPASVKTDMFNDVCADNAAMKKYFDWCIRAIPLGRLGEADEVARLVTWLASDDAAFLNGTLFPIDGSYQNTSFVPKPGQTKYEKMDS